MWQLLKWLLECHSKLLCVYALSRISTCNLHTYGTGMDAKHWRTEFRCVFDKCSTVSEAEDRNARGFKLYTAAICLEISGCRMRSTELVENTECKIYLNSSGNWLCSGWIVSDFILRVCSKYNKIVGDRLYIVHKLHAICGKTPKRRAKRQTLVLHRQIAHAFAANACDCSATHTMLVSFMLYDCYICQLCQKARYKNGMCLGWIFTERSQNSRKRSQKMHGCRLLRSTWARTFHVCRRRKPQTQHGTSAVARLFDFTVAAEPPQMRLYCVCIAYTNKCHSIADQLLRWWMQLMDAINAIILCWTRWTFYDIPNYKLDWTVCIRAVYYVCMYGMCVCVIWDLCGKGNVSNALLVSLKSNRIGICWIKMQYRQEKFSFGNQQWYCL